MCLVEATHVGIAAQRRDWRWGGSSGGKAGRA